MNQRTAPLSPDDGLFRLAGTDSSWIWVHTCPTPRCPCRSALVLTTHDGRETLEARGAPVWQAWMAEGGHYREVARTCADLIVFGLDIDTAQALQPHSDERLDLAQHPEITAIVGHIGGELLDAIGRLWYRGESLSDPVEAALSAPGKIHGWQRGEQLAWHEMYEDVRQDLYVLDEHVYEAWDFHCPIPSCDCAEVNLHFEPVLPEKTSSPGHVNVHLSGNIRLEPETVRDRARLEQLWAAFRLRYPRYLSASRIAIRSSRRCANASWHPPSSNRRWAEMIPAHVDRERSTRSVVARDRRKQRIPAAITNPKSCIFTSIDRKPCHIRLIHPVFVA